MEELNKQKGAISIYRSIDEWEWYDDSNTFRLFFHCLIRANWKDKKYKGVLVKRGQFITSIPTLSSELKLSIQSIRTSLRRLESTGEIAKKSTKQFTMITVCNFDTYQQDFSKPNRQLTDSQHSNNRQLTTTNKEIINNINNSNELYVASKIRPCDNTSEKLPHEKIEKETSHEVKSHEVEKNKSSAPKFSEDQVKEIYEAYPAKCFANNNRRLKIGKKNLEKIRKILKSGEFTPDRLLESVKTYARLHQPTDDRKVFIENLQNFSTFLNNIPDYSDKELGVSMVSEIIDENFTLDCEIEEGMLDGFTRKDRILCNRYLDGDFRDNTFVEVAEILDRMMGFEYRFGAEKLDSDAIEFDYS